MNPEVEKAVLLRMADGDSPLLMPFGFFWESDYSDAEGDAICDLQEQGLIDSKDSEYEGSLIYFLTEDGRTRAGEVRE